MTFKLQHLIRFFRMMGIFIIIFGMNSPVLAAGPSLDVSVAHNGGDFIQGEVARAYTITVTNNGDAPTSGTITVAVTVTAGLRPWMFIFGGEWDCPLEPLGAAPITLSCTRTTPLNIGESSSITFSTDVDVNAGDAGTDYTVPDPPNSDIYYKTETVNVTVSGGGSSNATDFEDTPIVQKPDLRITDYEFRNASSTATISALEPGVPFVIRMTIENRGGLNSGGFYPGVFLDAKRNYGIDHTDPPLVFGEFTNFADYKISPEGSVDFGKGCLYYNPYVPPIDPLTTPIISERGNYTVKDFLPDLPAESSYTQDVLIDYPKSGDYVSSDWDGHRDGLTAGSYKVYLYVDPKCNTTESFEENNSYGPITFNVGTPFNTGPSDVDISVGGNLKGSYHILEKDFKLQSYPGFSGGPLFVDSTNNVATVSSIRLLYKNRYGNNTLSELMGVPTTQLLDNYWMPAYIDNDIMDSQIRFTNTSPTLSTTIKVYIGGDLKGTYVLGPNSANRIRFAGLSGGPVQIKGTPGVPILAGMRIIYGGPGGNSFDEIMAYPDTQLDDEYWFPFYNHNNVNLDTELRVGNTSSTLSSTVRVYFGDTLMGTYTLQPSTNKLISYPGISGGPVRVVGTTNVPIVASLRLLYLNKYGYKTLSELMGVATANLLDNYSMPVYIDDLLNDSQVRFTNTSNTLSTSIQVYLGSTLMGTYNLGPSSANRIRFTNVIGGPIRIVGTPGVPILAGMRIIYGGVGGVSFDEIMAYPTTQLNPEYWFPFYNHNNVNLDTEVRIGVP